MIETDIYGFQGEGRTLCTSCAEKIYGNSLGMYLSSGDIHMVRDEDQPAYAHKGLLCDECFTWIFPPDQTKVTWWMVVPDPEEHLRLLAPFADFLETLQINSMNLRELSELSCN